MIHSSRHLLSNIARVVARDSSRTSADLQNLFTSLCEDSLIYPVFKDMKGSSRSLTNPATDIKFLPVRLLQYKAILPSTFSYHNLLA